MKKPERHNFEHVSHLFLVFQMLTLSKYLFAWFGRIQRIILLQFLFSQWKEGLTYLGWLYSSDHLLNAN